MCVYNTCDDDRFEAIARTKEELISATNIEDSPDEMAVIDSILFRFGQMGWLDMKDKVRELKSENLQLRILVAAYGELTCAIYRYWGISNDSDTLDDMKRIDKEVQALREALGIETGNV